MFAILRVHRNENKALRVSKGRVELQGSASRGGMQSAYATPKNFNRACGRHVGPRATPHSMFVLVTGSEDDWVPLSQATFTPDYTSLELVVSARAEAPKRQPAKRQSTKRQQSETPSQMPRPKKKPARALEEDEEEGGDSSDSEVVHRAAPRESVLVYGASRLQGGPSPVKLVNAARACSSLLG